VKNFNRPGIFKNINFSVKRGEILGIFGLVGAGRTEIVRSIIGLDSKESGEVYWQDKRLSIVTVNDAISNGIVMISEDRHRYGLIPLTGVRENVSLVALLHLYKKAVVPKKAEVKSVAEMIKRLSIKASNLDTKLGTLSGGNQQKVILARWLLVSPNVFIMDEPTRGIDVGTKYEIYKLMNEMTDNGMCIIMVNSDIEELMGMSDRIIVIREGEITGELEKKDATAEKIMRFAMGGQ
jgi:ABC-type sugar transport system ATPase subunit